MLEFTGDYNHCYECGHTWDYMETHCPNCGSTEFEPVNASEVRSIHFNTKEPEFTRICEMLESHGD